MQVTLNLPEDLVARAQEAGLLTTERVAELLENELKRADAARRFGELAKTLRAVEPPITEAEIQAELDARKAERLAENTSNAS